MTAQGAERPHVRRYDLCLLVVASIAVPSFVRYRVVTALEASSPRT